MSDISRKEVDAWPRIPSEPIERLTTVTRLYEEGMSDINGGYLSLFLSALLSRFVSKPTVSSRIKRLLFFCDQKQVRTELFSSDDRRREECIEISIKS